ncbi:putative ATP synthase subunit delta [Candidatus Zixiibacteriota bacterium]|nr:putative ATP synthase subunit delta [candidate division Zixibacteria bacterium]
MLAQQVGKKYGRALFELAREKNLVDKGWEQFHALAQYMRGDSTFLDFMTAPQIRTEDKIALVQKTFETRLEKIFYDFLLMLINKHRVQFLAEIVEEFDRLVREARGIVRATCITTAPLAEAERKGLIDRLSKKTGLKIELKEKIDKGIVGGMVVIFQDQIIDGSIRYALSLLRNRLMKVKVY